MVDRGFVPDTFKQPQTRKKGLMPSDVSVTGLARASARQGLFTPDNTPDKNIWYWRDLQGMAASALSRKELERLVPFFVELEANSTPGGWPKGGVTRIALPNNHLQYALTWFSLAGALLAVFAIAVRGRLRRRPFT
jgi:surfeit locus 1 family protein